MNTLNPLPVTATWQHPTPQGNDLYRMWGFPDGTFWAVGDAGTAVRFDGSNWTSHDTPSRHDLHGIWASSPTDIYACGFAGTMLHFDGVSWLTQSTPTKENLYAVWGSASNDIFVTGTGGSVWRRQSGAWQEYILAPGERFQALGGNGPAEVYAGGSNGRFYRFDGTNWHRIIVADLPRFDVEIMDMWTPAPGQFSLLDRFEMVWFDGAEWNAARLADENGFGVWGLSLQEQVAVSAGSATHLVNGVPIRFLTPSEEPLFDVWGLATDDYYAVGRCGLALHFDGGDWQAASQGSFGDIQDLCVSQSGAIAATNNGIVLRQDGATWSEESVGTRYDLMGIWQDAGLAVAVGRRFTADGLDWQQAILMNAGGASWTNVGPVGGAHTLFDVWGSHPSDLHTVGEGGEILHYDGSSWAVVHGDTGDIAYLKSIHGTPSGHIITVGRTNNRRARIRQFDGSAWTQITLNDVEELNGVWVEDETSAFAVGAFGAIRRFDGAIWHKMKSPTRAPLFCVWGTSAADIYAGGIDGTIVHYDGSAWRELLPATNRSFNAIAGRSESEILFAGDRGSIMLFGGL